MKIFSWNIRGLGGMEKRKEVRKLIGDKRLFVMCIQETKLSVCDDSLCATLWGSSPHGYSFRPSIGASGGLLVLWDMAEVEVWSSGSFNHGLMIHGRFLQSNEEFYLFNIYAPCENSAKQVLWDSLLVRLQQLGGKNFYVSVETSMSSAALTKGAL
jgi:exonuclease III